VLPVENVPVGPPVQTLTLVTFWFLGTAFAGPSFLMAARLIPDRSAQSGRRAVWWPWLFCLPTPLIFTSVVFGTPFSMQGVWTIIALAAIGVCISLLGVGTRNFRSADPSGRRQIKWVVFGSYIALLARALLSLLELTGYNRQWAYIAATGMYVFLPLCILIAVVRSNLCDVARLWSATASYTVIAVLLVAGTLSGMPRLADAVGAASGLAPPAAQVILSLGLAAVVVPAHRRLRPQIERVFFRERYRLERGVDTLLRDLATCAAPEKLLALTGERLDALLRPESCVIYARAGQTYAPAFVRGRVVPLAFDGQSPLVSTLCMHDRPIATHASWGSRRVADLTPFDRASLETLGARVVLPIKRGASLAAFVCLGGKRSGDIYTSTDLALLAGVVHALSSGLLRFDDAQVIREGREMQESLRRYVPAPIAAQLAGGGSTAAAERAVSALFVDIRGYSTYAEARNTEEVFITSRRFAETVSRIARETGGRGVGVGGAGLRA